MGFMSLYSTTKHYDYIHEYENKALSLDEWSTLEHKGHPIPPELDCLLHHYSIVQLSRQYLQISTISLLAQSIQSSDYHTQ